MSPAPVRWASLFALAMLAAATVATATSAATLRVLHSFCGDAACSDGLEPAAGLVADPSGNLYGTTSEGGASGNGVVFELSKTGNKNWTYQTIYSFCTTSGCLDGNEPLAPVIVDTQGNIYGTAFFGGAGKGVVFEISRDPQAGVKYQVLYAFCQQANCIDGSGPQAGIGYAGNNTGALYDGVSPLYGTTITGGSNNGGVAFRLLPPGGKRTTWREKVIHNFCSTGGTACLDGTVPRSTLTVDATDNVFGTTSGGGRDAKSRGGPGGVLFELAPNARKTAWSETVLHAFCDNATCTDGKAVFGGVIMDAAGNLFGNTLVGGTSCPKETCGVIYSFKGKKTRPFGVLYDFCSLSDCADGSGPAGNLLFGASGELFGTASQGGGNDIDPDEVGGGVVFQLTGTAYQRLYAFCARSGCKDGQYPNGTIVRDAEGNIFGTTLLGGSGTKSGGVIFELEP